MPRKNLPVKKKNNTNKIIVGGAIAAIALVVGLVALNALFSQPPAPPFVSASRDWGSPTAPITAVVYSDFQ